MRLIPLPEGSSIDLDDSALHEGVRADQLVVRCVVDLYRPRKKNRHSRRSTSQHRPQKTVQQTKIGTHDTDDARLFRDMLRAPCKVTAFETESAELGVPAADTDGVDTLRAELGVGGLATELELSLLAVVRTLGARRGAFVAR